jgi:hypothetical protein
LDKTPIRLPFGLPIGGPKRSLKQTIAHAIRVMAPTLLALSFAGVARAQGTMDFSGAQTLMGTFKTITAYVRRADEGTLSRLLVDPRSDWTRSCGRKCIWLQTLWAAGMACLGVHSLALYRRVPKQGVGAHSVGVPGPHLQAMSSSKREANGESERLVLKILRMEVSGSESEILIFSKPLI